MLKRRSKERGEADITRLFTQSHKIAPDYNTMFARMAWPIFDGYIHHIVDNLFMYIREYTLHTSIARLILIFFKCVFLSKIKKCRANRIY